MTVFSAGNDIAGFIGVLILAALYFTPTIVAFTRHRQVASVAVVNLFFGWTFIGWVVALVMAVRDKPQAASPVA